MIMLHETKRCQRKNAIKLILRGDREKIFLEASLKFVSFSLSDTVPLPRKIQSSLPKLRNLHLNVTDLVDEDILSYLDAAFTFIDDGLR